MKRIGKLVLVVIMTILATTLNVVSATLPKPTGYVNDYATLLNPEQGAQLNADLAAFEKATTIEIAVVTVPELKGQSIENFTRKLATEWGVGKRSQNNGIVFLIAPKERKMRIEVADGIRSVLTDTKANQIRDQVVLPNFKAKNMAQGIIDGTHAIMSVLDGTSALVEAEEVAVNRRTDAEELRIVGYIVGGFVAILGMGFILFLTTERLLARKYVLANKARVAEEIKKLRNFANHPDVTKETLNGVNELVIKFETINCLTAKSRRVDWVDVRSDLNYICDWDGIRSASLAVQRDIDFAQKARTEGPELLKKLPAMIEDARKKLAEGKLSSGAQERLRMAEEQRSTEPFGEPGSINWVIVYQLLTNFQSDIAGTKSTGSSDDSSGHSHHRSSGTSSGSSTSFSFGGGGGFSGGGSSGGW